MKRSAKFTRSLVPVTLAGALAAFAQTPVIQYPIPQPDNRVGASFRAVFNVDVDFENFGGFTPPGPSRQTPDGDPFNYDDGYVLTDSSGNLMGFTRYWGYDSASQLPDNGTILMHRSSSQGTKIRGVDDDPQLGGELTYERTIRRENNWAWGVGAGAGYLNVSIEDSDPVSLFMTQTTDAYALPPLEGGGFVNPPPAPYYHGAELSPEGNPVIGATPLSSSTGTVLGTLGGKRIFDADIFTFRLGPYLEVPLGENLNLTLSAGAAVAQVNSDFEFTETVSVPGVPSVAGSGSHNDLLVGAYVSGNVVYKLNPSWDVFGGVQYQDVGKYKHRENGRTAVLDLRKTFFVVVGASYSF